MHTQHIVADVSRINFGSLYVIATKLGNQGHKLLWSNSYPGHPGSYVFDIDLLIAFAPGCALTDYNIP